MSKSLEEIRNEYIKELEAIEKKIKVTRKRLKEALRQKECTKAHKLERLLFVYQDEKDDFEYSIKQLNDYCK